MTMSDDPTNSKSENLQGPALLPPPVNADKSVLRAIAALDASEASTAGSAPKSASTGLAPSGSAPVIDAVAHEAAPAKPAKAPAITAEPSARKPAGATQPLRANAFRANLPAGAPPAAKNSAWLMRAAVVALTIGGGWLIGANISPGQLPGFGAAREASAQISRVDQLRLELQQVSAELAAVRNQLAERDSPEARARQTAELDALKKSMGDLSRRIEQARSSQTAAASETGARIDRARQDEARQHEEIAGRIARLERQFSDGKPVASIAPAQPQNSTPNSTIVPRAAVVPPAAALAPEPNAPRKPLPLAGYALREVYHGIALIEGRNGFIEVYPGASIPGAGRVQSIVRRSGGWVVLTSAGVIGPKYD